MHHCITIYCVLYYANPPCILFQCKLSSDELCNKLNINNVTLDFSEKVFIHIKTNVEGQKQQKQAFEKHVYPLIKLEVRCSDKYVFSIESQCLI